MNFKWKGIMPAVTTKFLDNDKLDLKTFKINIEEQLSAGVHGIVLGGSLGESSTLDESEKKTLLNQTVEIVSGRIPVIMNPISPELSSSTSFGLGVKIPTFSTI